VARLQVEGVRPDVGHIGRAISGGGGVHSDVEHIGRGTHGVRPDVGHNGP
jgi:hypothetical protein